MGNGYNNHRNLHLHHHKGTFLPMLCSRQSIKDVALPSKLEDRSMSFSTDPLSPKIGCMGQVKRHNKITGFPASSSSSSSSSCSSSNKIITFTTRNGNRAHPVKYSKLKRIFSAKNTLISTTTTTTTAYSSALSIQNTTTCRATFGRREVMLNGARRATNSDDSKENSVAVISIEDMDPPLPVTKKVHKPADGGEVDTLWKRRSVGVSLKNLQLEQIQLNRHNFAPTTV